MDIISHGLWSAIIFKFLNLRRKARKKLNIYLASFFGIFPDILSFSLLFIWFGFSLVSGGMDFSDLPHPEKVEPAQTDTYFIYALTNLLYNITHSIFVFILVFFIIFFVFKKQIFEIFAWLIHILIDIPSHSYQFYPTPFLWPISGWKFNGISWANPKFIIINYSLIIIFYLILRKKSKINKT